MKPIISSLLTVIAAQSIVFSADGAMESPLSPEFIQWRDEKSLRSEENRFGGIVPTPVNNLEFLKTHSAKSRSSRSLLPPFFDLRAVDFVSPVKNQRQTGNCWAFTTMAALESSVLLQGGGLQDFSEKNLRNNHLHDNDPISDGGNDEMSIAYFSRFAGPVLEEYDPFDESDPTSESVPVFGVVKEKVHYTDEVSIKEAIMAKGALFTSMCSSEPEYQSGTETTYYLEGKWQTNHAVTLVGWDDSKVIPGAPGKGAWLVKNSWGKEWGDEGYFWLSYLDESSVMEAISFNSVEPMATYSDVYYYDTLGKVSNYGYGLDVSYAALTVTPRSDEQITAVGTYATAHNSSWKIRIYDTKTEEGTNSYFSDLLYETESAVGNCGYYVVDLPRKVPVKKGDDVYVVVEYTTPEYGMPIPVEKKVVGYSSGAVANPGETFSSSDGVRFEDMVGDERSACIKVLTSTGKDPVPYTMFESSAQVATVPGTIQFSDKSLNEPTAWQWDFQSDGTIDSYEQNPQYRYDEIGKYSVTLVTSNGSGSDTLVKENYISILDGSLTGDTVAVISDVPDTGYFPMSPMYENSWISSIYLSEEVEMRERVISEIQFHKLVPTGTDRSGSSMKIFISHTKMNSVDMTLADTLSDHCLYSGSFTIPSDTGWVGISLDKPFIYNGSDNIQVTAYTSGTIDFNSEFMLWDILPMSFDNSSRFGFFDNGGEETGGISLSKPAIRLVGGKSTSISTIGGKPASALGFRSVDGNRIQYTLPQSGSVEFTVYDMRGRQLVKLSRGMESAGVHTLSLNSFNLAKGVFLLQLQSESGRSVNRISIR